MGLVDSQPVCKQMNNCPEYEPEQKKPVRFAAWYLVQTSTKYLPVLPQLWQPMYSRCVRDLGPGAVQTTSGSTGKPPSQGCNTVVNLSDFFQAFSIRLKKGEREGKKQNRQPDKAALWETQLPVSADTSLLSVSFSSKSLAHIKSSPI